MKTQDAIQKFLDNRKYENRKPTTIQWYRLILSRFGCSYPDLPKRPEPIEEFLGTIEGAETRQAYFRVLKAFYRFASVRFRFANPMNQMRAPGRPKKIMPTLEPREVMQLINLADSLREKALLTLLVDTGARVGEIVGLRRQDIKDDTIRVNGKTGERDIPISDETRQLLLALIAANGESEYVFYGHKGVLTRHGVYRIVHDYMIKAGIQGPKLGPHRIRHAFGKGYLVNGGDLRSLQELMGHANVSTTQKYASLNLNDCIQKHHRFTPLRAAHAAAQESFFDTPQAVREAEAILKERG